MASRSFDDVVGKMREYLDGLKDCEPFCIDGGDNLRREGAALPEIKGVYCFYENGEPLYVGRSRNIRNRVRQHRIQSSGHNAAQFAFNLAKKKFGLDRAGNMKRRELENDSEFADLFADAKERVRKMSVRFVKIKDPIEQTVFEVYAHVKLDTPFNDFETH